jgi:hypothetical protein
MKAYVPLHLRKAPVVVPEKQDFTSDSAFPTLGNAKPKQVINAPPKKSFKVAIDELIAFEKLSEQERNKYLQRQKAMNGYVLLSLRIDKEWLIRFNERYITSVPENNHYVPSNKIKSKSEEDSDNESVLESIPEDNPEDISEESEGDEQEV